MANPVKLIKTTDDDLGTYDGGVQVMSDADLEYAAKLILENFATQSNTDVGDIYVDTTSVNATNIGTYTDSYVNGTPGTHPADETIYSNTYYFHQDTSSFVEGTIEYPIQYNGNGALQVQTDTDLNDSIIAKCISLIGNSTVYEAGTYFLQENAPASGSWVEVASLPNQLNTVTGANDTKLWRRTNASFTPTNSARPVRMPTVGTLQELTNAQIQQLTDRLRNRIVSTGIGTYKLQTSTPTGGTWVQRGAITDSRFLIANQQYTRGQYTREFSGQYARLRPGPDYTSVQYQRQFTRGQYLRQFTAQYTGQYTRQFSGQYTRATYTRNTPGPNYTGLSYARGTAYTRARPGPQYEGQFARQYNALYQRIFTRVAYQRGYTRIYTGNYRTTTPGPQYTRGQYTRATPGPQYNAQYTRRFAAQYEGQYTRRYSAQYNAQYTRRYGAQYEGQYQRQYTRRYAANYTRATLGPQYEGQFTRATPGPNYAATQYIRGQYTREFNRQFTAQYTGQYTRRYTGQYQRQYTRQFAGNYTSRYARRTPGLGYGTGYRLSYGTAYGQLFQRRYSAQYTSTNIYGRGQWFSVPGFARGEPYITYQTLYNRGDLYAAQFTRVRPGPNYVGATFFSRIDFESYNREFFFRYFYRRYTARYESAQFTRSVTGPQYNGPQYTRRRPGPQYTRGQYSRLTTGPNYGPTYEGRYNLNYGRVFAAQYSSQFERRFSANYTRRTPGPQYNGLQYTGQYTRVRPGPQYAGSQFTRVRPGPQYTGQYTRRRPGPQYAGTQFTRIYSAQYTGQYARQYFRIFYTRSRPGPAYGGPSYVTLRGGPQYAGTQYTRQTYTSQFGRVFSGNYNETFTRTFARQYFGQYIRAQYSRLRVGPQYSGQYSRLTTGTQYTGQYNESYATGPSTYIRQYAAQFGRYIREFTGQYTRLRQSLQYTGQYTGATIQNNTTGTTKYLWLRVA